MATRSEREKSQKLNEQHQAILSKMLREEDNKYCADCEAKGAAASPKCLKKSAACASNGSEMLAERLASVSVRSAKLVRLFVSGSGESQLTPFPPEAKLSG